MMSFVQSRRGQHDGAADLEDTQADLAGEAEGVLQDKQDIGIADEKRRSSEEEAKSAAQVAVASNSDNIEDYDLIKLLTMMSWVWFRMERSPKTLEKTHETI